MKNLKFLGFKIAVFGVLMMLTIMVMLGINSYRNTKNDHRKHLEKKLGMLADAVITSLDNMMITGNAMIVANWARGIKKTGGVSAFQILRKTGREAFSDNSAVEKVNRYQKAKVFKKWPKSHFEKSKDFEEFNIYPVDMERLLGAVNNHKRDFFLDNINGKKQLTLMAPVPHSKSCYFCHGYDKDEVLAVVRISIPTILMEKEVATTLWRDIVFIVGTGISIALLFVLYAFGLIKKVGQSEEQIKSLSRTLEATSSCNKALIRAKDESELLAEICRIVVEVGGYTLAWVGEAMEANGKRQLKPLAWTCSGGSKCDYLGELKMTWSVDEFGRGPTGTAIRAGKPAVMRSVEHDPHAHWREKALKYGFRSSISLSLMVSRKMFGALVIHSDRDDAFSEEEKMLLEEMSGDLAFGMTALRTLKEKKKHSRMIELLLESTSEGVHGVDMNGNCIFANASCLKILGYDNESELLGKNMHTLISHTHEDGTHFAMKECRIHNACLKGETAHVDNEFFWRKDGTAIPVSCRVHPVCDEGKPVGSVVSFLDITEQLRAKKALLKSHEQLEISLGGTISAISRMVEARDPYTSGHQQRVSVIACAIAEEMGLDENIVEGTRIGATIHDIGKIYLPAEILSKPTKLTSVEFSLIQSHPQVGYDILSGIPFPWPIADIAHQHHEKLDGSGYPQGLKNGEIRLESRIVAVADVVEAMASHRPYRPALGIDKALEAITTHRGDWYDPSAVDACVKLFTEKGFSLDTST